MDGRGGVSVACRVAAITTIEHVSSGPTVKVVIAVAGCDGVVAGITIEELGEAVADDGVIAGATRKYGRRGTIH